MLYLWVCHMTCFVFKCQVVENFYLQQGADVGPFFQVIFDSDEVSLDIPRERTEHNGWFIIPLVYPPKVRMLSKK